ncbi:MAG: hypothetical protein IT364_16715 [Candidatus Hydrogenedentes bacterium]|nr:hypothetical protein [Candidatus Hydrogenedentota bacterium]
MDIEELLKQLEVNAGTVERPIAVAVPGVGTLYVRKRTVLEFEQMATVREANADSPNGFFAPSVARLLCDEQGKRFPLDVQERLIALLARQPETVFHAIVNAADGHDAKGAINPN